MAAVETLTTGDDSKRCFDDVGTEVAEEAASKRLKGTGVFADLDDDGDDDDFGSIIADNIARAEATANTGSHSQSFSFGGAASMTTPRLPGAYQGPGLKGGMAEFDGEGPHEVNQPSVMCHCGLPCNKLEAKTEKNAGRMFFRCPKQRDEGQCQFFQWEDEPPRGAPTGGTPPQRTSPGAKPAAGGGGTGACFKCGQEGHWSRDCPQGQSGGAAYGSGGGYGGGYGSGSGGYGPSNGEKPARGGGGASGACFKCGQEGHFAAACPNAQGGGGTYGGNGGGYGGGGGYGSGDGAGAYGAGRPAGGAARDRSNDTCFKCGQTGHWSSQCPQSKSSGSYGGGSSGGVGGYGGGGCYGNSGGYGGRAGGGYGGYGGNGGGGGSGGACYKRGETGHFSRDCTKGGGGSSYRGY